MERRSGLRFAVFLALLIEASTSFAQAPPLASGKPHVDVLLVLAADVSRSIDEQKFELQRKGYAAALADPRVLEAIASNPDKTIAVAFMEWAGSESQKLVIDWTPIRNEADAKAFAQLVLGAPRSFYDRTAIGSALDFATAQFDHAPFVATRRIIDVSGDGASNGGTDIKAARDAALAHGVTTINGLVILSSMDGPRYLVEHTHPPGGLAAYYKTNVIGGVAAFVSSAEGFESFDRSLIAKIVEEIS
ncbi:DUF1194 domain-containing protein [Lichenihabitans psoromatis]|uniref:DUF1194 domain-containing protein n=1 Tax=Lichenihabitans psoromatis TaxID=2528642 RepID=UPI0010382DA9|nr:DUF1194 domain-containing protein [Lichenihabitans psoromatis]